VPGGGQTEAVQPVSDRKAPDCSNHRSLMQGTFMTQLNYPPVPESTHKCRTSCGRAGYPILRQNSQFSLVPLL